MSTGTLGEGRVIEIPRPAGHFLLDGGFQFVVYKKPSAWKRFWTRFFLGWKWVDE
jgi:hypothetical protein